MGVTIRGQIVVTFRTHTTLILKGKAERKVHLNSSPFDWIGLPQTSTAVWHIHCFREYEKLYESLFSWWYVTRSLVRSERPYQHSSPCCCRCAMLFFTDLHNVFFFTWRVVQADTTALDSRPVVLISRSDCTFTTPTLGRINTADYNQHILIQ